VTLEGLYDNDDCPWDDPTFDVSSATGLAQSVTVTVVSTCLNLSQLVSTLIAFLWTFCSPGRTADFALSGDWRAKWQRAFIFRDL
jgi:hypothetical protein